MEIVAILLISSMLAICGTGNSIIYPVILVPGAGGNQLEARLTRDYKPTSLWCNRWYPLKKDNEGWFRLWFDPSVVLAPFTRCFTDRMRLHYDSVSDDYHNAPGIQTRVPSFGSTSSLLWLDPNLKKATTYMAALVDSLEEIGYMKDKNLFGAPYDFRYGLAAKGHPSRVGSNFLQDLKHLIEKASDSNGGNPVIIVSHSLGGLFIQQLLNRNTPSWRKKYIKHFVALSTPWGGAIQEMLTFASGYTLGIPIADPLLVRAEQRSCESNMWLLPSPKLFGSSKPIVVTPNVSYTANDMERFLVDIGFEEGVYPYRTRILPLIEEELDSPGVATTCIIGKGVKTAETYFYGERGFDVEPEVVYGDGDGTVNLMSLLALQSHWKNQSVKVIELSGISHTSILQDEVALKQIIGVVSYINSDATATSFII